MNQTFKVTKRDVASLIAATFPEYTGRSYRVEVAEAITFSDLHWGGGSRNSYRAVRLDDGKVGDVPAGSAPWNCPTEGLRVEIPEGVIIVEHCHFCGKDLGLRIYVNPANLPRLLPAKVA